MTLPRPRLQGKRLELRPLEEGDLPAVEAMLAEPEVHQWWGRHDSAKIRRDLLEDPEWAVLAIVVDGAFAGIVAYGEEADPMYRSASVDITLAEGFRDRGLGREAIVLLARWLHAQRGHHRLTIDPAAGNERAIRAYAGVGFRPVGVMRAYELAPDGSWSNSLLMDLLIPSELDQQG
jgi:aminoglycoside 6'-N-acetyltransferase